MIADGCEHLSIAWLQSHTNPILSPNSHNKWTDIHDTCVLLVSRPVIRAALAAFLPTYIQFVRFYICCWVNKERKKEKDNRGVRLAVTAHYIIDSEFCLCLCLLECLRHTTEHPATELQHCIHEWHPHDKVQAVVTGRMQVLEGKINAGRYTKEVLEPKMMPSAHELFGASSDFIFQ